MTFFFIFSEQGALVSLSHNIGKILVLTERHIFRLVIIFPSYFSHVQFFVTLHEEKYLE